MTVRQLRSVSFQLGPVRATTKKRLLRKESRRANVNLKELRVQTKMRSVVSVNATLLFEWVSTCSVY